MFAPLLQSTDGLLKTVGFSITENLQYGVSEIALVLQNTIGLSNIMFVPVLQSTDGVCRTELALVLKNTIRLTKTDLKMVFKNELGPIIQNMVGFS